MNLSAIQLSQLLAVEQRQQSLEFAAVAGGGVELEGNPASIKSISECIQFSNARSFSSCILRCSAAGSRRQLSIRKNERKGESDEPYAPLLLERELTVGEGDVVIGRKQSDQTNNSAGRFAKNPASRTAVPSNPSRHKGSGASRSPEASFTLSSLTRLRQPTD
ncbi:hypothetical protein KBY74_11650 [Cyanobium sp. A1C-AMD]|uniref:hypothetical protein n=1 Tax=Cyanobium sp. A1C-AMD TaxID=2823694 RepID=UPI0020CC14B7|nr:hypothetical protein [Cyanobium sp. A1C-AMD]MCP9880496.1 hypothetical protein [Cyanobium sp. A1C-AMD]